MPPEQAESEIRHVLKSRRATQVFGRTLARVLEPGDLVVLTGDLGAGKTTLVRSIARGLGVPDSVAVTSPTFELVHELPGRMPVIHADLYRLAPGDDLDELGLLPRIGGDAVVLVEWGDKFAGELGREGLWIDIALQDHERACVIRGHGRRGEARVKSLVPLVADNPADLDDSADPDDPADKSD
jgi:tRNA threonylcarbamoyladenosine biosynthesis protein TsaE